MYPNEAGVMDGLLCGDRLMPPAGVSLSRYDPSPRWVKIRMAWREAGNTRHNPIVIYEDVDSDASTTCEADDEMSADEVDSTAEMDVAEGTVGHPILVD